MKELPKKYDALATEKKWQEFWESNKTYAWDENESRENSYVIDTPPPTVSGHLHMGHIFSYTQADFIARFQRMSGKNVFYPMGFDDNGLPTERLVEKTKKTKAMKHSREEFTAMCLEVGEQSRNDFKNLFTSTALSVDWKQEYHTVSPEVMKISQMSFLDLYNKEQVYRKLQPMFWDPIDQTAIAQAEVEEQEKDSFENFIYFGLIDENANTESVDWDSLEKVEIMTTRPEMLPACVALMVHPDDISKYSGKKAVTPLFNAIVPIVADDKVQKDKGTGLVMCCTFGDETDVEWWKTHKLDTKIIINKFGKIDLASLESDQFCHPAITSHCHPAPVAGSILPDISPFSEIQGKKIDHQEEQYSARKIVIRLLEENGLTVKEKVAITHAVKCAERSGSPLELIPTEQWFINIMDHKNELKERIDECNWHPSHMAKRAHQWVDSLSWDWCISRQRYFGVPFPVWYSNRAGEEGKVILPDVADLPVNPLVDLPKGYSAEEVIPEKDVMDTWATSSVSPQINSKAINTQPNSHLEAGDTSCVTPHSVAGLQDDGEITPQQVRGDSPILAIDADRHQKLFPADLRPQAHEIIRTWAFYTIAKAHLHEGVAPWKNLMISGWCLASDKTKMSKSKGNVITPEQVMEANSADVVRYWSSTSKLGADTAYSPDVLKIGKKLANKLWNATKFAALHLPLIEGQPTTAKDDIESGVITESLDKWVISKLGKAVERATDEFAKYEYSVARSAAEDFFWNDFCDNYLEAVKRRTYDDAPENEAARKSALFTIHHCLEGILKLFAPFLPHITDELYTHIFDSKLSESASIHDRGSWPKASDFVIDVEAEKAGEILVTILEEVRKFKAEKNVSIKFPIKNLNISSDDSDLIKSFEYDLTNVTSSENINYDSASELSVKIELGEAEEVA